MTLTQHDSHVGNYDAERRYDDVKRRLNERLARRRREHNAERRYDADVERIRRARFDATPNADADAVATFLRDMAIADTMLNARRAYNVYDAIGHVYGVYDAYDVPTTTTSMVNADNGAYDGVHGDYYVAVAPDGAYVDIDGAIIGTNADERRDDERRVRADALADTLADALADARDGERTKVIVVNGALVPVWTRDVRAVSDADMNARWDNAYDAEYVNARRDAERDERMIAERNAERDNDDDDATS